jgi:hypothetical protein
MAAIFEVVSFEDEAVTIALANDTEFDLVSAAR